MNRKNKEYAQNEINLGLECLKNNPNDQIQKDRVAYWSLVLGDLSLAEKYASSEKMDFLINQYKNGNN